MAKAKIELPTKHYHTYVALADLAGISFPKKGSQPTQLNDIVICVVSFRDPFYLMKWERLVHDQLSKPKVEPQQKKK